LSESAEPPDRPKHSRSLLGFYIAVGILAALVGLGVALAPAARFQYHSWRHRTERDPQGKSLKWLADYAARRHLDRAAVKRLLGPPLDERPNYLTYRLKPCPLDSAPLIGYFIMLEGDKVLEVQPWPGVGIR
jgi:hypothetical protein